MNDTVKFGNKITTELLCFARPNLENEYESDTGFELYLLEPRYSYIANEEDVCIDTVLVEYSPPENMNYAEFIKKAIETLRDKQKQALADAEYKVQQLEGKISKYMMLTHYKPQEDNVIDIQETKNNIPF